MFNVTDQNSDRKYKTVAYLLLLAFTFLFPLAITTAGTEITFYGSAGILILLSVTRRTAISFYSPLVYPVLLFGTWSLIGLFFALDLAYSLHDLSLIHI